MKASPLDLWQVDPWQVDLWTVPLTSGCAICLSEQENLRANRFRFEEDRVRWTRARSSLRLILSTYAGEDPGQLEFVYGEHGKPGLSRGSEIQFNLSHSGDWALVAVTRLRPVGVDLERVRPDVEMGSLLRRLGETDLPISKFDLFQRWTRREARSKAAGGALFDPPAEDICGIDVAAPPGYAASLAVHGCEPVICYRDAEPGGIQI